MAVLRTIVTVVFIIICVILSAIVLLQEGKSAGLGSISGAAESYWERIRDVRWKVHLLRSLVGLQLHFLYWRSYSTSADSADKSG